MADQPNMFDEGKQQETPAQTQAPENYDVFLDGIKNEKGERKYATVADALKGLSHAQSYITDLKGQSATTAQELDSLRKEASRITELEATLQQLLAAQGGAKETPKPPPPETDVEGIVQQALDRRAKQQQAEANQRTVVEVLRREHGQSAGELFYSKAEEFGLTRQEINDMAARSPKAVLKMFGVSEAGAHKQPFPSPNRGTVQGFQQGNPSAIKIGREDKTLGLGHTTKDLMESYHRAGEMTQAMDEQGLTIDDLQDPKTYFKLFG